MKRKVAMAIVGALLFVASGVVPASAYVPGEVLETDHFPSVGTGRLSLQPAVCDSGAGYQKVVVVYGWVASDRSGTETTAIRNETAKFDAAFERESGRRWSQKVDFMRDGSGNVAVCVAQLRDSNGDGIMHENEMEAQLGAAGLDVADRKYVVYVDTTLMVCSTREGAGCAISDHGFARYPLNKDVALHEMVHILGCCPGGPGSHVTEWYDLMGEQYGSRGSGARNCEYRQYSNTDRFALPIDCMKNQYYSTAAATGTNPDWVGTYGNMALSPYLTGISAEVQGEGGVNDVKCNGASGVPYGHEYGETRTLSFGSYFNALEGRDNITDGYLVCGGDGADTIQTLSGTDTLSGGAAGDSLYGGADNDTIYDGWGIDTIDGGAGVDTLYRCDDGQTENITSVENLMGPSAAYCHHNYQ